MTNMAVETNQNDIAVVGIACRFPGDASSTDAFLQLLQKGAGAWSKVPQERFDVDAYYHPSHERRGTTVAIGGHFLRDDISKWDAPFCKLIAANVSSG
jgi:acyl transferase domain-containing protein